MLNRILEYRLKNDGYDVKVFINGEDAVSYMFGNPFDLLITDLYMPLMNGMEVIQSVRDKISESIPIVAISAAHEEELINRVFNLGANDFIVKPFRAGELSIRVKRLLE
ncbi:MAG: response regulator [Proteobacteria bacterium]|nr:response regulator [Pseudomonadota bacterium]